MPHDVVFFLKPDAGTALFVQQSQHQHSGPPVVVFVSSAGNFSIIALVYMKSYIAFAGNNGHFHNKIDLAAAESLDASKDLFVFLVSATF